MFEVGRLAGRSWGRVLRARGRVDLLDIPRDPVVDTLKEHGAVLFRDFAVAPGDFAAFTDRFCDRTLGRLHGGQNRRGVAGDGDAGDHKTSTVNLGRQLIGPHAELAYSPMRPDLLWFYCVRPAARRGETTVFDGIEIWSTMPDDLRELFRTRSLRYRFAGAGPELWPLFVGASVDRPMTTALLAQREGVAYALAGTGGIDIEYVVPAVVDTRYQEVPAFANSVIPTDDREVSYADGARITPGLRLALLKVCNRSMAAIAWRPGDVLMIDNSRMMHGRMPFSDAGREVHVRMGMASF